MRSAVVAVGVVVVASLACGGPTPVSSPGAPAGGARVGKHGGGRHGGGGGGGGAPAPAPVEGGGSWLCWAEGVYTSCSDQGNGYESCLDDVSRGGGQGATQADAQSEALQQCTTHMLNMVITNNTNGHASVKQSCQITECGQ